MGNKNWYVIHTYAGFEGRVKTSLLERANQMGLVEKLGQVLVPTEDVIEIKDGKRRTSRRKFFPGYVLVELETPLADETLQMIKETPKVTGFVGSGSKPVALPHDQVDDILRQMEAGAEKPKPKSVFQRGDKVRVIDGPFVNFQGVVDDMNPERGRMKVVVPVFGRPTSVELEYYQVERI